MTQFTNTIVVGQGGRPSHLHRETAHSTPRPPLAAQPRQPRPGTRVGVGGAVRREGGTFRETETRNAICLAFLNACDSAVAPLDDLAQLAELDLNAQRRDR